MATTFPRIPDPTATHNERVKLRTNLMHTVGLGLIGFAVLRPAVEDVSSLGAAEAAWFAGGLVFHQLGYYYLGKMRRDEK